MLKRAQAADLLEASKFFPVLAILGPRQSGKTTLAQATFPSYAYVSLEDVMQRALAAEDPRGFLARFKGAAGVIIDEFQYVPSILSYIQLHVDAQKCDGYFILTGSQNFLTNQAITQSLAGRISIHTLLPLSLQELVDNNISFDDAISTMYAGFYPAVYAKHTPPERLYASYVQTYVERDVRDMRQIADLRQFQTFIKLCAGRIGQILNLSSLANDCSISVNTAKAWISLLEASYIIFLLQPHFKNFSKRLIKSPKLYFYDTGLACYLLQITQSHLQEHYLRGGLFESMIIADFYKTYYNRGKQPSIYFWRDLQGNEVDCILDTGAHLTPIEIKSGQTVNQDFFKGLDYFKGIAGDAVRKSFIIYAGAETQPWTKATVLGWKDCEQSVQYALLSAR